MRNKTALFPRMLKSVGQQYQLYLLALPAVLYFFIFCYVPMYGVQLAFRDYYPGMSTISGAEWIGLDHFFRFFRSYLFGQLLTNTLRISLINLVLGFPLPIILALMLNELTSRRLKKSLQSISYAPYFISAVAMAGILSLLVSDRGLVNWFIELFGGTSKNLLADGPAFTWVYVVGNVWKNAGWNSIIYIAALSAIDVSMYEAAKLDGASKLQCIRHIDFPSIMPTMIILLILECGKIMSLGWEQILVMQNALNISHSEIISTYTYKLGLINNDFSFSTAVGLFNSVVNFVLLIIVNTLSRAAGEVSLW